MAYEIQVLDLIDIELESSFLVLARNMGKPTRAKTWSYLLLGPETEPIIVDTGARSPEIMQRLHMTGLQSEEQRLENQLARHGVKMGDVRWIVHTHHHIDHAGQDERFPKATVITNRRELEYSVSGIMGGQYPPEYVKHHVDRLHTPGALRLLDLELAGPDEIFPGVVCEAAGGHTEGSMNVKVETTEGVACICGDVIYDIAHQLVDPHLQVMELDPAVTGNHGGSKRGEKAAIRKALSGARFVLPAHDRPGVVEHGRIVGRTFDSTPGPLIANEDFPGKLTSDHKEAAHA